MTVSERKQNYFQKLSGYFQEYQRMLIVSVDMVGSKQIQKVRMELRGKGELLFGKNTMVRKCIRTLMLEPGMEYLGQLIEQKAVAGNTGFLFLNCDFSEAQKVLKDNFVGAAARAGVIAPLSVKIPAGPTSLQPTETSFFQALNIPTKISKGSIEILADVDLVQEGSKVTPGASALLAKLGVRPFTYGLEIQSVMDGQSIYPAAVLDISDADIVKALCAGIANVAAISLGSGYPTLASIPHSIVNGYKNVLSISLATDYTFPLAQKIKDFLSDPEAMAAAAAAAAAPAAGAGGAAPAAEKAPEPEPEEEEEEEDMDFDLFD